MVKSMIQAGVRRLQSDRMVTARLDADVVERTDEVEIVVDAPGVDEADIQVRYLSDTVLIRMDRFRGPRDGFDLAESGRSVGFDGRVPLPDDVVVDPESATATLQANGTLLVRLPKPSDAEEATAVATADGE